MRKLLFLLLFLLFCSEFVAQGRHGQQQNANVLRSFRVRASQEQLTAEQALSRFAGNIYRFSSEFPQEKVYLQFDNTSYYQGETIWFKAYVVEAATHHRALSRVLYVDLISPEGVVLKQEKLKIVAGQADGSFPLVDGSTEYARELRGTV